MITQPVITCAFTLFNCEDTILRAITSCLNQEYPHKEILLVDDCSSDKTLDTVRAFLANTNINSRLICLKKNMGVAYARNVLIDNCNTEYIAFFDDDDESHPIRLNLQIEHLENYKSTNNTGGGEALCFTDRVFIKQLQSQFIDSIEIDCSRVDIYTVITSLLSANKLPYFCRPGSTATCTLFSKTSTLKKIGGFDPNFRRFEDLDLAIRAINLGISLTTVKQCLVKQYFTNTLDKQNAYMYNLKLINKYQGYFQTHREFNYAILYVRLKNKILHASRDPLVSILLQLLFLHPHRIIKHTLLILQRYLVRSGKAV